MNKLNKQTTSLICKVFKPLLYTCVVIYTLHFTLYTSVVSAASSPIFRANANRTGTVIESAKPTLIKAWSYEIQGNFVSSPVVYKGKVICASRDQSLYVWNAYTGTVLESFSIPNGFIDATPCVSSDTIYVPATNGYFYAFSLSNEVKQWERYTGSQDCSSPVLYNGCLYFVSGSPNTKLFCLDAKTGAILNSGSKPFETSQFGFSSPAIKNNRAYFGTNDGNISCMDIATGKIIWSNPTKGGILYSTLSIGDSYIYAVSDGDEHKFFCLNPDNGNIIWESNDLNTKTSSVSSVCLTQDKAFIASTVEDGSNTVLKLFAFPLTGSNPLSPVWTDTIGIPHTSGMISSPVVSNDTLYIGSGDGNLYCINTEDGKFIEPGTGTLTTSTTGYFLHFNTSISSGIISTPCISNGYVYVAAYDGMLYAFKASNAVSISYPDNDDTISKGAYINATLKSAVTSPYLLEYGQGASPTTWIQISSGTANTERTNISYWNTMALTDGSYSIRLTANNDINKRAINTLSVNNPPPAPTSLTAFDKPRDSGGTIKLIWTKSTDDGAGNNDVANYKIYRGTSPASVSFYAQVAAGTTFYFDNACPINLMFYYKLTSYDGLNESLYSNTAKAFSILDGESVSNTQANTVTLNLDGYTTYVLIDTATFSNKVWIGIQVSTAFTNVSLPSNVFGTNIVRDFTIYPASMTFLKSVTIKLSYKQSDLANISTEGNLRLFRWDNTQGLWQLLLNSQVNVATKYVWAQVNHFSLYRIMQYNPPLSTTLPGAPQNLTAIDTPNDSGGKITLNWTRSSDDNAGSNDVSTYRIFKGSSPAVLSYLTQVSSGTTVFIDSACPLYVMYYYKVSAVNTSGFYQYSNQANAYSEMDGVDVSAANGGTIDLIVNGSTTTVVIMPQGLSNNAKIGIKIPHNLPQVNMPSYVNATNISRQFTIKPSSTTFLKNLIVKIPYKTQDITNMKKENLRVFYADTARNSWKIVNTSDSSLEDGRVWATIPDFYSAHSYYRLMEYMPGKESLISGDMVYTYPNPATGDKLFFKYYLGDKADINIDIYNIAGELIAHLTKDNNPAGIFSEIEWNIKGIASGVYIYRLVAKTPYGNKDLKKKLAVIH